MPTTEQASPTLQNSSRDFLIRAQRCFAQAEKAPEMLLYAALELRLGIEARLNEHRTGAEQYADLKKRGWRVADLARDLEKFYKTGTQIVSFTVLGEGGASNRVFLFTPVTRRARQIAQQLGDYLHYTERFNPAEDMWKKRLEALVIEGMRELEVSTIGTLLAPPMWKPKAHKATIFFERVNGETVESVLQDFGGIGTKFTCKVDYHDSLPVQKGAGA